MFLKSVLNQLYRKQQHEENMTLLISIFRMLKQFMIASKVRNVLLTNVCCFSIIIPDILKMYFVLLVIKAISVCKVLVLNTWDTSLDQDLFINLSLLRISILITKRNIVERVVIISSNNNHVLREQNHMHITLQYVTLQHYYYQRKPLKITLLLVQMRRR